MRPKKGAPGCSAVVLLVAEALWLQSGGLFLGVLFGKPFLGDFWGPSWGHLEANLGSTWALKRERD